MEADAEGGQAAQQGADAVHLVGAKAQSAGGYEVVGPVVDEDALIGPEMVLVQQGLVDAGVGLVDLHFAGGHAAVEETLEVPVHQQIQHVLGDVAQVVDAVAALLELLHQRLHPAAGVEHAHPVVQHALHLEAPAHGPGPLEHPLVGLPAGDAARVQQPPFSAAEGQVVDLLFQPPVPEQVDEVLVGVEIHHDAAEVEHDIFIHR